MGQPSTGITAFSEMVWPGDLVQGHRSLHPSDKDLSPGTPALLVALTLAQWFPSTVFPKMR
jgi:hypothetical protein